MAKKYFSIYPRTKEAQVYGIQTQNGAVNFGGKTVFNTSDAGLVEAIKEQHKKDAYVIHDEQLSKAYDSGNWDVVQSQGTTSLKTLHNYTFTQSKPNPLTLTDRLKRFITRRGLTSYFWIWDVVNANKKREVGIRLFGVEFVKELQ